MKNKIVLIAFSLNLLLAMTSCSFYAVATIKQNEKKKPPRKSLTFQTLRAKKRRKHCQRKSRRRANLKRRA